MRNRPRRRSQAACGHGTKPAPHQTKHFVNFQGGATMPDKDTLRKAKRDKRQGKAPSTQAGEFVREEIHKSAKQARREVDPAGDRHRLAKARRAGVERRRPRTAKYRKRHARARRGPTSEVRSAAGSKPTAKRKRATLRALSGARAPESHRALAGRRVPQRAERRGRNARRRRGRQRHKGPAGGGGLPEGGARTGETRRPQQ